MKREKGISLIAMILIIIAILVISIITTIVIKNNNVFKNKESNIVSEKVNNDLNTTDESLLNNKVDSLKNISNFDAEVYLLSKEEGGRHTPFFSNYKPTFNFEDIKTEGIIYLPSDVEMAFPGKTIIMNVQLEKNIPMQIGTEFSIMENERTIGRGKIIKTY